MHPRPANAVLGIGFALSFQMAVVAAAQALPVVAPFAYAGFGFTPEYVGYFSAIVCLSALLAANGTAGLLSRWGSVTGSCATLFLSAVGVAAVAASSTAYALLPAAILLGIAYGPVNPAGSRLLVRVSGSYPRSFIFAMKQASVSIGVALASALLPALALLFGWRIALLSISACCLVIAAVAVSVRGRLGDDANLAASIRFRGPVAPARALWAEPDLRALAIGMFSFSMAQFGLMSMYVTLLWSRLDMAPETAAAMASLAFAASIFGRLYWGWRANTAEATKILAGLAACGAVTIAFIMTTGAETPLVASVVFSGALGLGPLSWSGVFLAEVARNGEERGGIDGVSSITAGMMVFGYLGGIAGPGLFSLSAGLFESYDICLALIAAALAMTALLLARPVGTGRRFGHGRACREGRRRSLR